MKECSGMECFSRRYESFKLLTVKKGNFQLVLLLPSISVSIWEESVTEHSMITEYSRLRIKTPPYKKEFQTLETYNSKTERSRTKLTWKKHAKNSFFYSIYKCSIGDCVKEDHCGAAGLSKNWTKSVFLRGIDCTLFHITIM